MLLIRTHLAGMQLSSCSHWRDKVRRDYIATLTFWLFSPGIRWCKSTSSQLSLFVPGLFLVVVEKWGWLKHSFRAVSWEGAGNWQRVPCTVPCASLAPPRTCCALSHFNQLFFLPVLSDSSPLTLGRGGKLLLPPPPPSHPHPHTSGGLTKQLGRQGEAEHSNLESSLSPSRLHSACTLFETNWMMSRAVAVAIVVQGTYTQRLFCVILWGAY